MNTKTSNCCKECKHHTYHFNDDGSYDEIIIGGCPMRCSCALNIKGIQSVHIDKHCYKEKIDCQYYEKEQ